MIATTRGLIVLGALAFVLLVIVVLDAPDRRAPIDRALIPGFAAERVTELRFARPGQPEQRVTRTAGTWRLPSGAAEPMAIDGALAALRGARWHRRADKARAGTPGVTVSVVAGPQVTTLAIGRPLPGTAQTWIVRGDEALLVDGWVAHALAPEPLALVVRHPLAEAASAKELAVSQPHLRLHGNQLVEPFAVGLDPKLAAALYDACAELAIVELAPAAAAPQDPAIRLTGPDALVQFAGACPGDRVHVAGTPSSGCVERAAWDKLVAAATALARPAEQVADPRPLAIKPITLTIAGTAIDLRGGDADRDRVDELLAALATPAAIVPHPATPPASTLVASDGTTQVTLELYAGVLARAGEPIALRPTRDAWTIITRPAAALRDPTLWREDPLTISSLTLDAITYTRGAVIGEWARAPAGAIDPALVDALVETLVAVRAPPGPAPSAIAHRMSFTVTPPAGKPTTHTLELASPTPAGCAARVDGTPVRLPLPLCTATAALAARR